VKKPRTIKAMLALLASMRKENEAAAKRHKIEMKRYDKLLAKEEAQVTELEARYKIKAKRYGKKLR
jgi:phage tail tape-measure protein